MLALFATMNPEEPFTSLVKARHSINALRPPLRDRPLISQAITLHTIRQHSL